MADMGSKAKNVYSLKPRVKESTSAAPEGQSLFFELDGAHMLLFVESSELVNRSASCRVRIRCKGRRLAGILVVDGAALMEFLGMVAGNA